jgi:hypothetical protein
MTLRRNCPKSPDIAPTQPEYITLSRRMQDTIEFCASIPPGVTAIAGVPRSGMFTASIIAEYLHLALCAFSQDGQLVRLLSGARHRKHIDDGLLLVIDDTVATGMSMRQLPSIDRQHITAALYCSPEHTDLVDLHYRKLSLPHYLEWNLFNSCHAGTIATDFDGVLCEEPPCDDQKAECKYERWLQSAPVRQRPRRSALKLIATGRTRRYRRHTELWLERWGIQYDALVMWEGQPESRWIDDGCAKMKADAYANSEATLFVESNVREAAVIAQRSGKRVICTTNGRVLN